MLQETFQAAQRVINISIIYHFIRFKIESDSQFWKQNNFYKKIIIIYNYYTNDQIHLSTNFLSNFPRKIALQFSNAARRLKLTKFNRENERITARTTWNLRIYHKI